MGIRNRLCGDPQLDLKIFEFWVAKGGRETAIRRRTAAPRFWIEVGSKCNSWVSVTLCCKKEIPIEDLRRITNDLLPRGITFQQFAGAQSEVNLGLRRFWGGCYPRGND